MLPSANVCVTVTGDEDILKPGVLVLTVSVGLVLDVVPRGESTVGAEGGAAELTGIEVLDVGVPRVIETLGDTADAEAEETLVGGALDMVTPG